MTDDDKKKHEQLAREVMKIAAPAFAFVQGLTPVRQTCILQALEKIKQQDDK